MASVPARVRDRVVAGLKRFQPVLNSAKSRDVNESDTVTIVTDLLADIFGFDKYSEITSEFVIRGTYVDLAIKIDGKLQTLIEVKAIGLDLKDAYVKQAVDYAANQGVEWVVLTSGVLWRVYRVTFNKPIDQELILEFNLLDLSPKSEAAIENLFLLTREGMGKSLLDEYHAERQVLSRFYIGAVLLSESVLDVVRRELRKMSPDVRIENAQIRDVLMQEVIKREVVEGDKAEEAQRKMNRAANKASKKVVKDSAGDVAASGEAITSPADDAGE